MNRSEVVLADSPGVGHVQLCGCNCIHLSIGPVTLNLDPAAFAQAANLVWKAMNELSKLVVSGDANGDGVAIDGGHGHVH